MTGLIISGLPASGKGTQCKKVASEYGLAHLDTGENLRQEIAQESTLGLEAKKFIAQGKLVPDTLIQKIMVKVMGRYPSGQGFVFDGFPRTIGQARMLEDFGKEYNLHISGMIYLKVREEQIIERIRKRAQEAGRRDDQDPDIIQKRIQGQRKQLVDLKAFYQEREKYYEVDGMGDVAEVFDQIRKIIEHQGLLKE
ncbi:MAG: nucleoside monophosphate kinase [Bacteroidales bacterium]